MLKYNSLIKASIKKNYKNSTILNKNFYNYFCLQRNQNLKKLSKSQSLIDKLKSKDSTYKTISQIYNTKANNVNEKKVLSFYRSNRTRPTIAIDRSSIAPTSITQKRANAYIIISDQALLRVED